MLQRRSRGVSLVAGATFSMCVLSASLVMADGGGGSAPEARSDPAYLAAVAAIDAGHFAQAITLLGEYTQKMPNDANAWNRLGYAQRKSGQLPAAFASYERALRLDPEHRGAHEYLGEAYLLSGDLPRAEAQLRILDRLCWLPCEEYRDLKKAVAEYKAKAR